MKVLAEIVALNQKLRQIDKQIDEVETKMNTTNIADQVAAKLNAEKAKVVGNAGIAGHIPYQYENHQPWQGIFGSVGEKTPTTLLGYCRERLETSSKDVSKYQRAVAILSAHPEFEELRELIASGIFNL